MITLFLSIVGAAISLVLLILDKKEDKKRKAILSLASIGFLIFLGQQFLSYFSAKASEEIITTLDKRTKIIDTRTTRIDNTVSVLEVLISKMDSSTIEKIGIKVKSIGQLEHLHAFDKGNPDAWSQYYEWLNEPIKSKKALRFIINDDKHYNFSLVLLYLMTDDNNPQFVRSKIQSYPEWSIFPSPSDWHKIISSNPLCELSVFENASGNLVGFAKTKELLRNLKQIENAREFEEAINSPELSFLDYATKNLNSFKKSVNGESLKEISKSMISANVSETVSIIQSEMYYLSLSSLFEVK